MKRQYQSLIEEYLGYFHCVVLVGASHLYALKDFVKEFNCPFGIVVTNDEKVRIYDDTIYGIPFAVLTA